MPLDGTRYDEATQQLIDAKQLLIEKGWCRGARVNMKNEHCALGALDVAMGEMAERFHLAVIRLADAVPAEIERSPIGPAWDVAQFNNAQGSVESILAWFDRALA